MKFILELEIPDIVVDRLPPPPGGRCKIKTIAAGMAIAAGHTMMDTGFEWGEEIIGPGDSGPFAGGFGASFTVHKE